MKDSFQRSSSNRLEGVSERYGKICHLVVLPLADNHSNVSGMRHLRDAPEPIRAPPEPSTSFRIAKFHRDKINNLAISIEVGAISWSLFKQYMHASARPSPLDVTGPSFESASLLPALQYVLPKW
jgi:hypothetical protein